MSATARRDRPAETVTIALPARHAFVTRDAVAAVLTSTPKASLRQVREALGGGSLEDISAMVTAVRGKGIAALRDALKDSPELGGCVVDTLEQLVSQVAQLQTALREQQHAVAKPVHPSKAELREAAEAAVERAEARMVQRLTTMTAAITEVKRLVTATAAAKAPAKDVVATLPATLRSIEKSIVTLTHTVDADRRERELPVPPPAVAPEIEQLQDQVHRVTQTVDAQFGLVRRVAQAVEAPSTEIEALRGEVATLGKHVARLARRLPTPASHAVQSRRPIAPSTPPQRSPSRPSAVKIRAAVQRTAARATPRAAPKAPRNASGTQRPRQASVVGRTTPKRSSRVVRAAQGHQRPQRPATPTRQAAAGTPRKQKRTAGVKKKRISVVKRNATRSQVERKPFRATTARKAPAAQARGAKVTKHARKGRGRGPAAR